MELIDYSDYKHAAVIIPIVLTGNDKSIVFEKRADSINQGGEICFPGGYVEPDENPSETVIRELKEEMGIDSIILQAYHGFVISATFGIVIKVFSGVIEQKIFEKELSINSDEVSDYKVVPISYFKSTEPRVYYVRHYTDMKANTNPLPESLVGFPSYYSESYGSGDYPVYVYDVDGVVIWGITAKIIYHLREQL